MSDYPATPSTADAPADPAPGFVPLPESERARLLESVRAWVVKLVKETSWVARQDRADVEQDCLLALWKASVRYDPARGRFTTFAAMVCRGVLANLARADAMSPHARTGIDQPGQDILATVPDPSAPVDGSDDDAEGRGEPLSGPAREALLGLLEGREAGILEGLKLKAGERRLLCLVALEGCTIDQVAARLGWKLSIAENNIRNLARKLADRGNLPAELITRFRRWQELDAIAPARAAGGKRRTYSEQQAGRGRRKAGTSADAVT